MENYYLGNGCRWSTLEDETDNTIVNNPFVNSIPDKIITLLNKRGIYTKQEISGFFKPSLKNLHDPFLLDGMQDAVERISFAIDNKERILIYGDFDADGVSATSILVRFFRYLNVDVDFYIPDRVNEGYGISDQAIDYISNSSFNLVITVDCGISGGPQIESINEKTLEYDKKVDFIITDHHQCNQELIPEAIAILNPHLPNSKYPFKNLCGAGVALKLVQALCIRFNTPRKYEEYLPIVAIATIADIVELQDENRIITKLGMDMIIDDSSCVGIKALLDVSLKNKDNLNSYILSFLLAPRINAAGRMGDAAIAVKLFITDDYQEAKTLAETLNRTNTERQEVQEKIFKEAVNIIAEDTRYIQDSVIVVHNESWHHGVLGIVASKLVDKYHKPAFVLSDNNGVAVGSARSIEGFNLFKAMETYADLFIKFGGHEQAGGITLKTDNIDLLRKKINSYAESIFTSEMLIPETYIDIETEGSDISLKTAKVLKFMEPFGEGNKKPIFSHKEAIIRDIREIGNGKHLKLTLLIDEQSFDAVYFGKGNLGLGILPGHSVDVLFTQEVNSYRGYDNIQIRLIDMKLSQTIIEKNNFLLKAARSIESLDCEEEWLYNGIIDKVIDNDDIHINRDILIIIYKYIVKQDKMTLGLDDMFVLSENMTKETKININIFKLIVSLLIFDELGLLDVILQENGDYIINQPQEVEKVDLLDSEILQWLNLVNNND